MRIERQQFELLRSIETENRWRAQNKVVEYLTLLLFISGMSRERQSCKKAFTSSVQMKDWSAEKRRFLKSVYKEWIATVIFQTIASFLFSIETIWNYNYCKCYSWTMSCKKLQKKKFSRPALFLFINKLITLGSGFTSVERQSELFKNS